MNPEVKNSGDPLCVLITVGNPCLAIVGTTIKDLPESQDKELPADGAEEESPLDSVCSPHGENISIVPEWSLSISCEPASALSIELIQSKACPLQLDLRDDRSADCVLECIHRYSSDDEDSSGHSILDLAFAHIEGYLGDVEDSNA
ncbi:Scy1-Like Protein 2 [Manis pentadactyla]|nr:Scy1-Like Protein 2 [Manis pentadactyla]